MTDADVASYVEALQADAPHTANTGAPAPNGVAPPAGGYASTIAPAQGGILQAARPFLLPVGAAAAAYHLSEGNIWWTAGLGIGALLLQGSFTPPAPPPPAKPPWMTE